jgi:regulator of PEP synthase PpsR (kinase-PPPase family)
MNQPKTDNRNFNLHLVSDSTGETLNHVARACIAQFDDIKPERHYWSLIRHETQMDIVLEGIKNKPGVVIFTIIHDHLRRRLIDHCRGLQLPCIPVLEPTLNALSSYIGHTPRAEVGRQHALDTDYYARIEAMEFALACDDGQGLDKIYKAQVILVGVSRTSKTPTCLYLANRGIFVANIPIVRGVPLPSVLDELSTPLIVGLTREPTSLIDIRRNRLHFLHETRETDYIDPEGVEEEVREARKLFTKKNWPTIDVTRRSIEETSAEILILLNKKKGAKGLGG